MLASRANKLMNERTNELTVGGAATFFRRIHTFRVAVTIDPASIPRLDRISQETSEERKNETKIGASSWGLADHVRASMRSSLTPKSTYVLPYLLSAIDFVRP